MPPVKIERIYFHSWYYSSLILVEIKREQEHKMVCVLFTKKWMYGVCSIKLSYPFPDEYFPW